MSHSIELVGKLISNINSIPSNSTPSGCIMFLGHSVVPKYLWKNSLSLVIWSWMFLETTGTLFYYFLSSSTLCSSGASGYQNLRKSERMHLQPCCQGFLCSDYLTDFTVVLLPLSTLKQRRQTSFFFFYSLLFCLLTSFGTLRTV